MANLIWKSIEGKFALFFGRHDPLTPPRKLMNKIGDGDFHGIGREFLQYFRKLGELKPSDRVLEVGCGCGRMAVPLTGYLTAEGGYRGFDIMEDCVSWCQRNIQSRFGNFEFLRADVFNRVYHPKGAFPAARYPFPYPSDFFDFAAVVSVFTHMLAADMENYLGEISRVLRPGGRCLMTFFLLNEDSRRRLDEGSSPMKFPSRLETCRLAEVDRPEWAVAFDEDYVRFCFDRFGLTIVEPVKLGTWCGRRSTDSLQDMILVIKGAPATQPG